ncbi:MAG: UDP-N-acetylmuramoyl-tripeptide--D-alanyl-D-alanine ligase [Anaeromyxobacteraceae bacterium]
MTPLPRFDRYAIASAAGGRWYGTPPAEVEGLSTDTRRIAPGSLFVALAGERFDGHAFLAEAAAKGVAAAVVSEAWLASQDPLARTLAKGGALPVLAVRDTLAALGALARHHRRRFGIPLIGVTGSNGKTTTREMIGAILGTRGPALKTEGNLNNEIGVPLTLLGLGPEHARGVVELGMNHPGEIARLAAMAEPQVGVVTFAGPAHLEHMGSVDGVADAKAELYFALPPNGIAVANADDPRMLRRAQACGRAVITFSAVRGKGDVSVLDVLEHDERGLRFTLAIGNREVEIRTPLVGLHNASNAAAAAAATLSLGFSDREIAEGLRAARAVGRRLRIERLPSGVTLVDDCYNANPASMTAALATLADLARSGAPGGRAMAVLGDMLELGPGEAEAHARLGEEAAKVAALYAAFGPRSRAGAEAARAAGAAEVFHTEDLPALVAWVTERLREGDVLLVKGSRGMKLERLVEALGGASPAGDGHGSHP